MADDRKFSDEIKDDWNGPYIEMLVAALEKYGTHMVWCRSHQYFGECDCGWYEVLKKINDTTKGDKK